MIVVIVIVLLFGRVVTMVMVLCDRIVTMLKFSR